MSREIKFRAWDKIEGIMRYGNKEDAVSWHSGAISSEIVVINSLLKERSERYEYMQYIGVTDKNRKEIYEGDIVKFFDITYNADLLGAMKFGEYEQDGSGNEYPPTPVIGFYVEIIKYQFTEDSFYDDEDEYPEWNRKMSVLEAMNENTYYNFEVIGNVYENADLLKEAENE